FALADTNASWWLSNRSVHVTEDQLTSVIEYGFKQGQLDFTATENGARDYVVSLLYVLDAPRFTSAQGMDMYAPGVFTALPYKRIILVTPYRASRQQSSFFCNTSCTVENSVGRLCNPPGHGANANFTVGL